MDNHVARIAVIGGSGLYQMEGVAGLREVWVDTPFGKPSDAILVGTLDDVPVAFLPRHGRGHRFAPHEINFRANIWALKSLGVKWVLSVSAVGSMKESIAPGDMVVVDQFIDRTRMRPSTFFEDGIVAHVTFSDPVCPVARAALARACKDADVVHHEGGAYVCIEGPQFSTRAESFMHRVWDVAVVGMTNMPEARLAREAELAYATLAMATDYDCWHETHEEVSVAAVLAVMKDNVIKAQSVLRHAVKHLSDPALTSPTWNALEYAIMTTPSLIPAATRERLALLISHRLGESA